MESCAIIAEELYEAVSELSLPFLFWMKHLPVESVVDIAKSGVHLFQRNLF